MSERGISNPFFGQYRVRAGLEPRTQLAQLVPVAHQLALATHLFGRDPHLR